MTKFYFSLVAFGIFLDQFSKHWIATILNPYERMEITSFFNLVLVFNEGAAFSFLSDAGGWQRWFFSGLAFIISIVLVFWILRLKANEKLQGYALSLILAGAIGNLIDRVRYGHVVDFLDVYWQTWHWPAFNVADSAITLGVIFILWDSIFNSSNDEFY